MQSQIAGWEQSEKQVLCPLLASSPPPASDIAFKLFSAVPAVANFNPLAATAASFGSFTAATPQKPFEAFSTPTATQAYVFDNALDQHSYVNSLQSTISSNINPNQQFVANPLGAAQANANITEYLKNIAALNSANGTNSDVATTTVTDINRVLAALQPSTPTTTQLLSNNADAISAVVTTQLLNANNANSIGQSAALIAANPSAISTTNNPFVQPQKQAVEIASALLSNGQLNQGAQQQSSSIQQLPSTTNSQLASDLSKFLSSSLLQNQQSDIAATINNDIQDNPFLAPASNQQTAGAFKLVGSPQSTSANLFNDASNLLQKVAQQQSVDPNVTKSGFSLYSPQLTEALKMLRSPIRELPTVTKKPIPLNNSPIDLASFRLKDPYKWTSDDVVAWVLDIARRHNIPREDIGVIEFGSHNGISLTRLTEQNFKEINSSFGPLMYLELRRLLNDEPLNTIDDLIRYCKSGDRLAEDERPSTSRIAQNPAVNLLGSTLNPNVNQTFGRFLSATSPLSPLVQNGVNVACNQQPSGSLASLHHSPVANVLQLQQQQQDANLQQLFNPHLAAQGSAVASVFAHQRKQLNDLQQQQQMLHAQQLLQKHSPVHHPLGMQMPGPSTAYDATGGLNDYHIAGGKIRKNKDGRPRKRSQHTKGNKLWEFIRDTLKDPATCPTIVRWEDPDQGVFRIVESEKLARLWGEKKNNNKMTYEKLSRAMRTYYEKQILVPVPKSGLYPKKLVYKFGPGAHGWHAPPHLAQTCLKLQQHEQ